MLQFYKSIPYQNQEAAKSFKLSKKWFEKRTLWALLKVISGEVSNKSNSMLNNIDKTGAVQTLSDAFLKMFR